MKNVYWWMTAALCITGLTAWIVSHSAMLLTSLFSNPTPLFVLLIAQLVLVVVLSARIDKMSFTTATVMFIVYSILNGLTLGPLLMLYTQESVAGTFFITAGTFAAMAIIGTFVKKDLSGIGRFMLMALIGLIIASLVNIFLGSSSLYWGITVVGVLVFVALTAYDAQKIKAMLMLYGDDVNESTQKIALMGSLTLYLDFINLFLYLLRIFGKRD
ncbi:MAG: Bax inhibitor-1/YccA family protein [Paludibacter sp.]|nr:Bax inhibitor-1/YccA family protein [Bacteroidales bacterium]MCM1069741.1 Bax inhibitor-1/YccA family protein [Prevotella sp.]MCM1354426.1 Bax inhibitor-1/YccA family protein [Bacteroides sp.]MCM1443236.1 Bax inhibitor-1/YccA family protein [Muribaculum sp.]MCM1482460.1 Bax inhibitor-1/YccA family protein [Paludibacter sp.]